MARRIQIGILDEDPILCADFARKMGVTPETVRLWACKGRCSGEDKDGPRVKLETVLGPRGWSTSFAAYKRFIAEINPPIFVEPVDGYIPGSSV